MPFIDIKDVHKSYTLGDVTTHALRGVDLSIGRGEFTAIAGPSGSGKTTLLNLVGCLDTPDSGAIAIDGQDLTGLSPRGLSDLRRDKLGFVFQAYNLIPVLSARENVEFVMLLQNVPESERTERADTILNDVGLGQYIDRKPTEMSGGQQQRVAVARAIAAEPALILADEPTANLDSATGASLLDLMRRLNEEKQVTFVFSTHDSMVMERAKRLVLLKDGVIAEDETREG
jgi:putative ABC transport system ATP-binding protein